MCAQTRSHTHTRTAAHMCTGHTEAHTHTHAVTHMHMHSPESHTRTVSCTHTQVHTHTHTPFATSALTATTSDQQGVGPTEGELGVGWEGPRMLGRKENHTEAGSANVPSPLLATVEPGAFSHAQGHGRPRLGTAPGVWRRVLGGALRPPGLPAGASSIRGGGPSPDLSHSCHRAPPSSLRPVPPGSAQGPGIHVPGT